ncbi:MAG TPA: hypothetical protein VEY69_07460, partial [Lautropia sp.]|nr:hypothetical protein [Lautropia sp.]
GGSSGGSSGGLSGGTSGGWSDTILQGTLRGGTRKVLSYFAGRPRKSREPASASSPVTQQAADANAPSPGQSTSERKS